MDAKRNRKAGIRKPLRKKDYASRTDARNDSRQATSAGTDKMRAA